MGCGVEGMSETSRTVGRVAGALTSIEMTLDDLGTPLRDATFVVVDLETTGGPPSEAGITEFGAVISRGGQIVGEFQTLVNPGTPLPPFISVLTGITDSMVAGAPTLSAALGMFLEFAGLTSAVPDRDLVLVAHNAPYDVGFLKAACSLNNTRWPAVRVLDTAKLARATFSKDEVRNCKLGTLAAYVGASTKPTHRALDDARATVDVLHAIIARVGNLGVHSVEELSSLSSKVTTAQRRKRHLAEGLPNKPGVYIFRDKDRAPLYVGVSGNLRSRVRTYFTASEQRSRMAEMVGIATDVTPIVCATDLEARVRELRLIAEHRPRYNRRSKSPERSMWLGITVDGDALRGKVLSKPQHDHVAGPFRSRDAIASAADVLALAPESADGALRGDAGAIDAVCDAALAKIRRLSDGQHFESAAVWRDRLAALLRGVDRAQRLRTIHNVPEIVAACLRQDKGWDIHVIRYGRLAGAATAAAGHDPRPVIDALLATAQVVAAPTRWLEHALADEMLMVASWLEGPGVRLVRITEGHTLSSPVGGAARPLRWLHGLSEGQGRAA